MTERVLRWKPEDEGMKASPTGNYVLYVHYEALQRELDALKRQVDDLRKGPMVKNVRAGSF